MTAVSHAAAQGSVSGIAADADTGEPIAGSYMFEVIPGEAQRADILNFSGVRSRRTNAAGAFQFQADPPSITGRMWNWLSPPRTRRFHFYHPNYGLIWGREEKDGQVRIEASLRDAHRRQADAAELCGARRAAGELRETIRGIVCPPKTPERYANGEPCAEGPLDSKGRRKGQWIFRKEDGSIAAIGQYESGTAVGEWRFHTSQVPNTN